MPNQLDVISVLFFCKKSLLARHVFAQASVASETLTGVKMKKSGMFVYIMDIRMSFCTLTLAFLC